MSMYYREHGERYYPTFTGGRTKQSFKDSCDINKILKKAQRAGGLAHVQKYPEAVYGEFAGVDLLGAYELLGRAEEIFADLPSEVRREFNNNAIEFAGFASDPENQGKLRELIPAIAEPGTYFPNPVKAGGQGAGAATAPADAAVRVDLEPGGPQVPAGSTETPGASDVE